MAVLSRVFKSLSSAEGAREALLAAGFDGDRLSLSARHDEAGPVESNFAIGNGRDDPTLASAISPAAGGESNNSYQRNFGESDDEGIFVLMVDAEDDAQFERALELMDQSGAVDIDDLTGMRSNLSG